jgi:hypothetical protein
VKNKIFQNPNVIIYLRNILQNIGIEFTGQYYCNRFFLKTFIADYKRKKL